MCFQSAQNIFDIFENESTERFVYLLMLSIMMPCFPTHPAPLKLIGGRTGPRQNPWTRAGPRQSGGPRQNSPYRRQNQRSYGSAVRSGNNQSYASRAARSGSNRVYRRYTHNKPTKMQHSQNVQRHATPTATTTAVAAPNVKLTGESPTEWKKQVQESSDQRIKTKVRLCLFFFLELMGNI